MISTTHIEINASEFNAEIHYDDLPILPVRNMMVFPGVTFPINLVRMSSREVATEAERRGVAVGVVTQTDPEVMVPGLDDLNPLGVVAQVVKVLPLPDDSALALVHAGGKIRLERPGRCRTIYGQLCAVASPVKESAVRDNDSMRLMLGSMFDLMRKLLKEHSGELAQQMVLPDEAAEKMPVELLINTMATQAPISIDEKRELLAIDKPRVRAERLFGMLIDAKEKAQLANKMKERAHHAMTERQRNAFLEMQMEEIRRELYGDADDEVAQLTRRLDESAMPESTAEQVRRELTKLQRVSPQSPDYQVLYGYVDTVLSLPWGVRSASNPGFAEAAEELNSTHSCLDKVHERVLEHLAQILHSPDKHAPILCLVGPPGVGKTSLGQSIAHALGREFQRVSLGGLHDESEIRGHRRTYIGSMPGRIIEAIRRAGTSDPVLMLDEIDKVGTDYKGDPSAALLEVLDPEQNAKFHDNYVDVDFDLSRVVFITTANTLSTVQTPLIDRMEVIHLSGYSPEEKTAIATEHLIPTLMKEFELDSFDLAPDALRHLIDDYTAESGVRQLQKRLASLMRKQVYATMQGREFPHPIAAADLHPLLGPATMTRDQFGTDGLPGVVTGLAWTAAGGEVLFIESVLTAGKGENRLTLTGNLGDVMKESAAIAHRYVQAHAADFGIDPQRFAETDLHIHVPEGAIPKDGPSAGVTMTTAIVSAYTGRPVREHLAMTGEMTLRGRVLPVGGIKEKTLAAKRAGVTDIILSSVNRKDVEEIPAQYLHGVTFHYVDSMAEVIKLALA